MNDFIFFENCILKTTIPILQMNKLRHRKVMELAQGQLDISTRAEI